MIKNIIFDVGNVLVDFKPEQIMEKIGIDKDKIEALAKATVYNDLWGELDLGVMDPKDVVQKMKEETPSLEKEIDLFFAQAIEILVEPFSYSASWLKSLKERGYKVYLLSNYPQGMFEIHSKTKFIFLPYIDGKVVSGNVKMVKPNLDIYEYLLKQFQLKPEECVFLDDRAENIEAAEKAGIHGIQFLSYEDAVKKLEKILSE